MILPEEPIVHTSPKIQTFVEGSTVNISCHATAYPAPTFTWSHLENDLDLSRMTYDDLSGVLQITDAQPEDSGNYLCTATNKLGRGTAVASLEYIGRDGRQFTLY